MSTLQWATSGTVSGLANNQQGNAIAAALATASQGASAPTPSSTGLASTAGVLWHDTTNNLLKLRDQGDTTWITLGMIDEANKLFTPIGAGSKEFVINGGQLIDQRNEGTAVSITSGALFFVTDQMKVGGTFSATGVTAQQIAVTNLPGYSKALKVTIGTGAAVNAGDNLGIVQNLEGISVAELGFGTSAAKTLSLGFWAQTSLSSMTFGVGLCNNGANRSFFQMATLAAANTWQWIPIASIPGDTAGTWSTGIGQLGIQIRISLSMGSTFQGSAGSWLGSNVASTSAQTQLSATSGATFMMTGLTLRALPAPVLFDRQDFAAEFARCLRYYEKSYSLGTAVGTVTQAGLLAFPCLNPLPSATYALNALVVFKVPKANPPAMQSYSTATGAPGKIRDQQNGADVAAGINVIGTNSANLFGTAAAANTLLNLLAHWTADAGL